MARTGRAVRRIDFIDRDPFHSALDSIDFLGNTIYYKCIRNRIFEWTNDYESWKITYPYYLISNTYVASFLAGMQHLHKGT